MHKVNTVTICMVMFLLSETDDLLLMLRHYVAVGCYGVDVKKCKYPKNEALQGK